ncbi:MAG TPA: DUF1566 domain-containing protein [Bacteroidales bacterium]
MNKLNLLIAAILMIASFSLTAQVAITTGGGSANASAMLDVQSTSKGFLLPRMTFVQKNAIIIPAAGLMVWCSNCGESGELEVFNGTSWTNMMGGAGAGPFAIGQSYGGGIIFYIDGTGEHGLISATNDLPNTVWGCSGTTISGADGTAIGTGNQNTIDIMAGCSTAGIAARLCGDLDEGGYQDWFLPSKDELFQMFLQADVIGGFVNSFYWSSSEIDANYAWILDFDYGDYDYDSKDGPNYYVRAVRSF